MSSPSPLSSLPPPHTDQRTVPKLQSNRAYIVLRYARCSADHTDLDMGLLREDGVYMEFEDAVRKPKEIRLSRFNGFVTVTNPVSREIYPFRNKIGQLSEDDRVIGWGYHWVEFDLATRELWSIWTWIEKTLVHRRRGEMGEVDELSASQLRVLEAEGRIDYVAVGQHASVLPANAVFDDATQNFVFDGEDDGNGGEHQG